MIRLHGVYWCRSYGLLYRRTSISAHTNHTTTQRYTYNTTKQLSNHIKLHKIALTGDIRPGTDEQVEFRAQLDMYLENAGEHIQYYPQYIQLIKERLTEFSGNQSFTSYVNIPYNRILQHCDNEQSIVDAILHYIKDTLQLHSITILTISDLPPTEITSMPYQHLFHALDIVCTKHGNIVTQGYAIDSVRFGLPVDQPQYISLQQLIDTHKPQYLIAIKTPINLCFQSFLHHQQITTCQRHGIQVHATSPLISKDPVEYDDVCFYTFESHDQELINTQSNWTEYIKSAFETGMVLEQVYADLLKTIPDTTNLPSVRDISIAHALRQNQSVCYNAVRFEHILYNDIMPSLDKNIERLKSVDSMQDWLRRYRFIIKTLLHRYAITVQHTTYHQNQRVSQFLDTVVPQLSPLKQLESKVFAILQCIPSIHYVCTDNPTYMRELAEHDIVISAQDAEQAMKQCWIHALETYSTSNNNS